MCEKCGTPISKLNLAPQKKNYSVGTLYCTKRPNFCKIPKMIAIILLLRSTALKNTTLSSIGHLVTEHLQAFTVYDNVNTLKKRKTLFLKHQMLNLMITSTALLMQVLKRSCALVNNFLYILNLNGQDIKFPIMQKKSQSNSSGREL